jgi:hypothetical protein
MESRLVAERDLLVRILGDDKDLQRALANTEKRVTSIDNRVAGFGRNISRAFAAAGITLGTAAVFKGLSEAIADASALNEEVSKSQQVFGDSAVAIEAWSKTTANSLGIAQVEALRATGTFGNLFATVGAGQEEAAAMSQELVTLAADLASFNNADISDVLLAIRSGLIGEAEPLRRYGVLLSETRVQQEAMAASGKDNVKELTNQEKALARYNIILNDTAVAQGDFGRTSEGLANQSRILRAQLADLSAELGTKLLPAMLGIVSATNDLIDAFTQAGDTFEPIEGLGDSIETIDVSQLVSVRDRLAEIKGEGDDVVGILDQIITRLKAVQGIGPRPDDRGGIRGPGAIDLSNARVDAKNAEKAAREAKREQERARKAFDEFIKGQGLKLDRASLTKSLNDDLAVLRAIEAAIQRRIQNEGRTFDLVQQLTDVRQEIARTVEQQAAEAEQAGEDAFNATIDALSLDLDIARETAQLADDQSALRAMEEAILRRIESEGRSTDLMRQLFQVREEQKQVAQRLADQQRERRRGRQFEALGLTEEGQERTPGIGALRRRGRGLIEELKASGLDEAQVAKFVKRISAIFTDQFDKAGRDVRQAILRLFQTITQTLDQGDKQAGRQITPGGIRPLQRLVAGANLTAEQLAILERNMQRRRNGRPVNAFGFDFDGPGTVGALRGFPGMGDFGPPDVFVTVEIDGQKVTGVVKKELQKTGRRRTNRRGGAGAGRGAIL